jgi:phage terminase large subunit
VYGEGLIGSHEGLIYKEGENWKLTDYNPPTAELTAVGMDWGFSNDETALVGLWRYELGFYLKTLIYRLGMLPDEYPLEMARLGIPKSVPVYADSASPMMIEKLKLSGYYVFPSFKYAGSVEDGIRLCQDQMFYLGKDDPLFSELLDYQWKIDKNGNQTRVPMGKDHALDAVRYAVEGMNKPKRESVAPVFF